MSGLATETTCDICRKTIPLDPDLMYGGRYYCPEDYRKKTGRDPYAGRNARVAAEQFPGKEQRYGSTRAAITVLRAIAVLGVVGSIVYAVMASAEMTFGAVNMLTIVGSFLGALFLLAGAEGLQVILDMEEHQRAIRLQVEEYTSRARVEH